jgi:hypothetical protein
MAVASFWAALSAHAGSSASAFATAFERHFESAVK